ncbi:MAG: SoxR reducing system RseC family protein [Spirochaetes bacterium]|nr:SoxR reducing system RseC family protein [Spirochaetota bacterium]
MIKEKAIIVNSDNKNLYVKIIVENNESCSSCKAKSFCNANDKEFVIPLDDSNKNFNKNEEVYIILENISILKLSLIVYGIPFVFSLLGIFLGYFLIFSKFEENIKVLLSFIMSVVLLLLSLVIVKIIDRKFEKSIKYNIKKVEDKD